METLSMLLCITLGGRLTERSIPQLIEYFYVKLVNGFLSNKLIFILLGL